MKMWLSFYSLFVAVFIAAAVFLSVPVPALAQDIVPEPICFTVVNKAPYKVYGDFRTDFYTTTDGGQARHKSNFRLDEAGSKHETEGYPLDMAEFCSYGPFLPERKLLLTLRTLVPIFECKTSVENGPIIIEGHRKPEGGTKTWANCL